MWGRYKRVFYWVCLVFLSSVGLSLAQSQTIHQLRNKAERLYEQGKYEESHQYYQKAYGLSLVHHQPELAINLLVDLSSMDYLAGNYQDGINRCLHGIAQLRQNNHVADSTVFKLNSSLGELYRLANDYDSSAHYFNEADRIFNRNPKLADVITEYVIYHFSNQAMLHESVGRFSVSEVLALKALQLARDYHERSATAIICNVLAGQYEALDRYPQALNLRLEGVRNYTLADLQLARMYSGIGWNLLSQKKYDQSLQYLQKSHQLYRRLIRQDSSQNDTRMVVNLYNHLGQCYWRMGRYQLAESYLNKALSTYSAKYGTKGRLPSTSWLIKGRIYVTQGHPDQATICWQHALTAIIKSPQKLNTIGNPSIDDVLDEKVAVNILYAKGAQLAKQACWADALQTYQCAIDVFHQARKHLGTLADKLYLSETVQPLYQQAQEVAYHLYRQNRTESAFGTAFTLLEQGRATILQDFQAESAIRPQYLPKNQLRLEQQLRQDLSSIRAQLLDNPSIEEQQKLTIRERDLLHKHYLLLRQWEKEYPDYYYAKYLTQPVTIRQVQARLPKAATYVTFNYCNGKLHAFALTNQRSVWKTIVIDSTRLFQTLDSLRTSLSVHPGISRYTGTPYALLAYEWFITPLLSEIDPKEDWIINTGGVLDGLSVDAFETGRLVNDYVCLHHTVRYVYTATNLVSAIAPVGGTSNENVLTVAPFTRQLRPAIYNHFRYETLAASAGEFDRLPTRQLVSDQATRKIFLAEQKNYSIWFLSTHAYLDNDDPMRSYVAFYPDDTTKVHRLYADEISQMSLRHVRLVALTACEAGRGKLYQSEGMMSLARAFAYAGCPTTISTLWTAHDRTSAFLIRRTYEYLQQGYSPATALRKARTDFFELDWSRPYNHPYFWSHLVVIGADAPLYESSFQWPIPKQYVLSSGALLIIVGLLVGFRYSHFRRKI